MGVVPYTFASQVGPIGLSQLDANFAAVGLGSIAPSAATSAALASADALATGAGTTLVLPPGTYATTGSLTLNAPVVQFQKGAMLSAGSSTATLTINGLVSAGAYQVFSYPEQTATPVRVTLTAPQTVLPQWFGAKGSGDPSQGADDSFAIQQASDALVNGGTVSGGSSTYPTRFPICILGKGIHFDFRNAGIWTDQGRTGRPYDAWAVQIGNSREVNLSAIRTARVAGNFNASITNGSYVELSPGTSNQCPLTPAQAATSSYTQSQNCSIDINRIDYFADAISPSTYGVQFSNALNCQARIGRTSYCGQAWGLGSDTAPNTPFAICCTVVAPVVEIPNQTHTYYSQGFLGFASLCEVYGGDVLQPVTTGTTDGNMLAFNYAWDCKVTGMSGNCGRGANGQGYWFGGNTYRCRVKASSVKNCPQAFANASSTSLTAADANRFIDCDADTADYLMATAGPYCLFKNVRGTNIATAEVYLQNVNGANCTFEDSDCDRIVYPSSSWSLGQAMFYNNFVSGPIRNGVMTRTYDPRSYIDPSFALAIDNYVTGGNLPAVLTGTGGGQNCVRLGNCASIPVATQGSGYTAVPTVSTTNGTTAAAMMGVVGATLVSGGNGYPNGSNVPLTGNTAEGSPYILNCTIAGGVVQSINNIAFPGLYSAIPVISGAQLTLNAGQPFSGTPATVNLSMGVVAVIPLSIVTGAGVTASLSGGSPLTAATLGTPNLTYSLPPVARFLFPLSEEMGAYYVRSIESDVSFSAGSLTTGTMVVVRVLNRNISGGRTNINNANTCVGYKGLMANSNSSTDASLNVGVEGQAWLDDAPGELWAEIIVVNWSLDFIVKLLTVTGRFASR